MDTQQEISSDSLTVEHKATRDSQELSVKIEDISRPDYVTSKSNDTPYNLMYKREDRNSV